MNDPFRSQIENATTNLLQAIVREFNLACPWTPKEALIANDPQARKICQAVGSRHIAVPRKNERAFATALRKLGFTVPV